MTADYLKSKATRHKNSAVKRRHRQIAYLAICSLSVIIFGFALATLIRPAHADGNTPDRAVVWREGYEGFGTTHEKNKLPHYPNTEYTPYKQTTNYTKAPKSYTEAMDPVFNFTHMVFDKLLARKSALPPGKYY